LTSSFVYSENDVREGQSITLLYLPSGTYFDADHYEPLMSDYETLLPVEMPILNNVKLYNGIQELQVSR
jgi:hypothetical protein